MDSPEIEHTPAAFVPVSQWANHETPHESAEWFEISKVLRVQFFRFATPVLSKGLFSKSGKSIPRLLEQLRPTPFGFKLAQEPSRQLILRISGEFGNPRERFLKKSRHVLLSFPW